MTELLLDGVRPYGEGDPLRVLISDGHIQEIAEHAVAPHARRIDGAGGVLLPGFVDLHTHLREPGGEEAETIASGSAAAALGGFTAVFAMANTNPVADNALVTEYVRRQGRLAGLVDVQPVGAVSAGLHGSELAELGEMAAAGVSVFSDDGHCVDDPVLMRRALEYAGALGAVVAQHAEEPRLTEGAQAHEGPVAARLGLTGWPSPAEESVVARDCLLAAHVGARLHVCHVSTAGSAELIAAAKRRGCRVTAEVTPHHLLLDESRLAGFDPVFKVNPPLRGASDTTAMRRALAEGVLDCVATDHAPHALQHKDCEWQAAKPGMLGLQTALPVVAETMLRPGLLDWRGLAAVLSHRPAEIGGLPRQGRPIAVGEPANLTLVDPDAEWSADAMSLASLAANTPYAGMRMTGRVHSTVYEGALTVNEGRLTA